jgi:peptidoglycan/xylan/chitin deacetylase (PgdA/CDA1 family)
MTPRSLSRPLPALGGFWRAALLALLLLPLAAVAQSEGQAVILQYHHVSTATPPVTSISAADLRVHLQYLKDEGFSVLRLEDAVTALQAGEKLPDRSAVITFDDGYLSVYEAAFPLLQEFGYPFTVFVTSGLVTSNGKLYASWEQLREMGERGATLANHTVTHPYLVNRTEGQSEAEWLAWVRSEIEDAEAQILAETGQSHKLLAYPYGEYDNAIQQLVRELGYVGIGQQSGPINPSSDFTALPRFPFSGIYASMNTFPTKVQSLAFNVAIVAPQSLVTDDVSPSAELQFTGNYRFDALNCFNNNQPMQVEALDENGRYRVSTQLVNEARRFRYNCTAPGPDGRYYWFAIPFLNPQKPDY